MIAFVQRSRCERREQEVNVRVRILVHGGSLTTWLLRVNAGCACPSAEVVTYAALPPSLVAQVDIPADA